MKKNIVLFFGSFNPIHVGHLIIANTMANVEGIHEVWLVVSPQNPFKQNAELLNQIHRLKMVQLATRNNAKLKASNVEFNLPKPSFTVNTLEFLTKKYAHTHHFSLLIGGDNWQNFDKWKNYAWILNNFSIFVYQRTAPQQNMQDSANELPMANTVPKNIIFLEAPLLNISATYVRNQLANNKSIRYLCPQNVCNYIYKNNFYR